MSSILPLCRCGCGQPLSERNPSRRGRDRRQFIRFHHNKHQHRNTIQEILLRLVVCEPKALDTGCWEWPGATAAGGYGKAGFQSRTRRVHEIVYEHFVGDVPAGKELHHRCHNPVCGNFEHLVALTPKEHMLEGNGIGHRNLVKTHCSQGHEYSEDNTYWYRGCRQCRQCRKIYRDRGHEKKRKESR
jgi:HNH endonuclease